jgi:type I restriction enzyme S subunit
MEPVRLKELIQPTERLEIPVAGKIYRQAGIRLWGEGAYERESIDGIDTRYKTLSRIEADDIVVNKIWARNGSVAVIPGNIAGCFVSSEFPTFVINKGKLSPRWFYWYTKTRDFWNQCDEKSHGTSGKNRIRPEKFLEIIIPLPPLPEQRRIVERIDNAAEKIDAGKKLAEEVNNEINALEKSFLFSIFRMRERWIERQVKDICYHPQYGYTESATYEEVGPRFLRITDIQNGHVAWENVPFCNCPNPDKYLLQKNDILFTRTGATTGKSFLIEECPRAVFASYLIRLRLKEDVLPEYLYLFFQSPLYWQQVHEEKKGTGQPNLNGAKLSNIIVPIPGKKDDQQEIVRRCQSFLAKLSDIRKIKNQLSATSEALLPSILSRAFSGSL